MHRYKLLVVAPEGDYVTDTEGTLEECRDAIENMGSRWFFYPFPVVVTLSEKTIVEAGGGLVNMDNKKPYLQAMFNRRRLKTFLDALRDTFENTEVDSVITLEGELIDRYLHLVRWDMAESLE